MTTLDARPDTRPDAVFGSSLDPLALDVRQDPHPRYHALRAAAPVVRGTDGVWVTSSFAACETVLNDPRFGHLEAGEEPTNPVYGRLGDDGEPLREPDGTPVHSFIVLNPPDHTRIRGMLSRAFSARLVEQLRDSVVSITDRLLDDVLDAGPVDLLRALAYPLPVAVIGRLLGVPDGDFPTFDGWATDIVRGLDPAFAGDPAVTAALGRAREDFAGYFAELAAARRARPTGDLLSEMVAARDGSDRLTDTEIVVTSTLLLIAGYETTANLIGNSVHSLLLHPDQEAAVRARRMRPSDVDELLRHEPPGHLAARVARTDVEVGGVRMRRGDSVLALLAAANRDPAVFADPDRLDLDRRDGRHLAFGHGIHLCLGRLLARQEGEVALDRLFARAARIEQAGPLTWRASASLRGLERLELTLRS